MKSLYLTGIGLWTPGFATFADFLQGEADDSVTDCRSPWVPPRLLRGASRLTRMLGEVAAAACVDGQADPQTISTITSSAFGEIETMLVLLETIFAGDGQLSPMRFKNAVHNSASGLGSIGSGNRGFATALAGGPRSFEVAILEAFALAHEREGEIVLSIADDELLPPLAALCPRIGLAIGLCLSPAPNARHYAVLRELQQDEQAASRSREFAGHVLPEALATNPAADALGVLRPILERAPRRVALAEEVPRPFSILVEPGPRELIPSRRAPSRDPDST